jgi:hypothetical protein
MSKLTLLHINIIGAVVAILLGVGLYFLFIPKALQHIKTNEASYQDIKSKADTLPQAKMDLQNAIAENKILNATYKIYQSQYMPTMGYNKDAVVTMMRVFMWNYGHNWPRQFTKSYFTFMRNEENKFHLNWVSGKSLTFGPYGIDPSTIEADAGNGSNPESSTQCQGFGPILHYSFHMLVTGPNMASLLRHVKDWNSAKGMGVPVVSNVRIFRVYSTMFCRYDVNTTIILHEKVMPEYNSRISGTPSQGGGGQGAGPGGMGGYPMGGMPGYSGGGGGGMPPGYPGAGGRGGMPPGYPGASGGGGRPSM